MDAVDTDKESNNRFQLLNPLKSVLIVCYIRKRNGGCYEQPFEKEKQKIPVCRRDYDGGGLEGPEQ